MILQHVVWDDTPGNIQTYCGKENEPDLDFNVPVCPDCMTGCVGDFHYVYSILKQTHNVLCGVMEANAERMLEQSPHGLMIRQLAITIDAVAAIMTGKKSRTDPEEHPVEVVNKMVRKMHDNALQFVAE